jgi:hypothetical protein
MRATVASTAQRANVGVSGLGDCARGTESSHLQFGSFLELVGSVQKLPHCGIM